MIIKGQLITCKREVKEFKGKKNDKENLYITLADVKLSDKQLDELNECFKDSGAKFTPDWVKNPSGYVNLKTEYALPCRDLEGNEHDSVEEFIKTFAWVGATVLVSVKLKEEGAVYPNAIVFKGEGKAYNPFAEFDNDDED